MNGQIQSRASSARAFENQNQCSRLLPRACSHWPTRSRIAHALSAPRSPSADVASAVPFIVPLALSSLSSSFYFSVCSPSFLLSPSRTPSTRWNTYVHALGDILIHPLPLVPFPHYISNPTLSFSFPRISLSFLGTSLSFLTLPLSVFLSLSISFRQSLFVIRIPRTSQSGKIIRGAKLSPSSERDALCSHHHHHHHHYYYYHHHHHHRLHLHLQSLLRSRASIIGELAIYAWSIPPCLTRLRTRALFSRLSLPAHTLSPSFSFSPSDFPAPPTTERDLDLSLSLFHSIAPLHPPSRLATPI